MPPDPEEVLDNSVNRSGFKIRDSPGFLVRFGEFFKGGLRHVADSVDKWASEGIRQLPGDALNDHGPIFYAVHIWNEYAGRTET